MAKYACFFSIILVSVFFFKTSFYTCTTYQTLKFGIEKFIPWVMIKLNGSEASRFNGYMNHHVKMLFQPESHQSPTILDQTRQLAAVCSPGINWRAVATCFLFLGSGKDRGDMTPRSGEISWKGVGGVVEGGVAWDFHEKRHWWRADLFWSWMIMVGMEMKILSIQNYTKHSWKLGSLKDFVFPSIYFGQ